MAGRRVRTMQALGMTLALCAVPAAAQTQIVRASNTQTVGGLDVSTSLEPGDMLRLKIWREPDFSGDYIVDERGMAVLPRLGSVRVTGIAASQLKTQLTEQYREYLNNPSIEVTPLHRVAIVGAVRNPGVYRTEPSQTIGDVVNLAGGATPQAKSNVIELRRGTERRVIDLKEHPELSSLALASNDQVYVPEKSWLKQNATWFVSTLIGVVGTTAYLVSR